MLVRTLDPVIGNPSHLVGEKFESRRLLLEPDNLGSVERDLARAG